MPRCLLSFLAKFGLRFSFEDYNLVKYFLLENSYFHISVFSHLNYHFNMYIFASEFIQKVLEHEVRFNFF